MYQSTPVPDTTHDQIPDDTWYLARHRIKRITECHIKISLDPLKNKKPDRGRHKQFSGSRTYKLPVCMFFQIISCAHTGNDKQQHHKPWIQYILHRVLILYRVKRSGHTALYHYIIHIDYMIDHNEHYRHPADVVNVMFSHIFPTFALIFNIIIAKAVFIYYHALFTF